MTPDQHMWREFGRFSGSVAGSGRALARLAPAACVTLGRSHRFGVCERWGGSTGAGTTSPRVLKKCCRRRPGTLGSPSADRGHALGDWPLAGRKCLAARSPQGCSGPHFLEGNADTQRDSLPHPPRGTGRKLSHPSGTAGHRAPLPQTTCRLEQATCFTQGPPSACAIAVGCELPCNLRAGTLCLRGQGTQLQACVSEKQLCRNTLD